MPFQIKKEGTDWILTWQLASQLSTSEVWSVIATTEGFQKWFTELQMLDNHEAIRFFSKEPYFEEIMHLLHYQPNEKISYEWDCGTVTFEIALDNEIVKLFFYERLPENFPNRMNDMAGWLVKKEMLAALLNRREVRADFNHAQFVEKIRQEVEKLAIS